MKRTLAASILLLGSVALGPVPLAAQGGQAVPKTSFGTKLTVAEAVTQIQTLVDQSAPADLAGPDVSAYQAQTQWLRTVLERIKSPGDAASGQATGKHTVQSPRDAATGQATGKRQHKPFTISKEWDALRMEIEGESRRFNTLSNASKARHDIAMNAIRNMK